MDLTEAEDIKKRWQEYTEELYKKDLHDPANHGGVITHLEPEILEPKIKWDLGNINIKLVEVMAFQLSYFKSWKMMLWKCCTIYASTFGKLSSGHRTGKGQFSFQSKRKAMPKNAQTTAQLHLSHASNVMLKIFQAMQYVNHEFPDVQAGFRKGRGTRDQIANICWIIEQESYRKKIYLCFIDYAKAFDCVDHNQLWKILKEMGIPDHLICLLRNLYAG